MIYLDLSIPFHRMASNSYESFLSDPICNGSTTTAACKLVELLQQTPFKRRNPDNNDQVSTNDMYDSRTCIVYRVNEREQWSYAIGVSRCHRMLALLFMLDEAPLLNTSSHSEDGEMMEASIDLHLIKFSLFRIHPTTRRANERAAQARKT